MRYYIYRTGSNSANQPMEPGPVIVAEVEAKNACDAVTLAYERVSCYANQHLHAEDADAVDDREAAVDRKVRVVLR